MKTKHPQINAILEKLEDEDAPFVQVHRLIDLFETIIKTHAAYLIAEYLKRNILSDRMKALLAHGMVRPALGMWQLFSREIMKELVIPPILSIEQMEKFKITLDKNQVENLSNYYDFKDECYTLRGDLREKQLSKLKKYFIQSNYQMNPPLLIENYYELFNAYDDLISNEQLDENNKKLLDIVAFRNIYAHGATAGPDKCKKHLNQYKPLLYRLLEHPLFQHYEIVYVKEKSMIEKEKKVSFKVYLKGGNGEVCLSPILFFKQIKDDSNIQYFFFNDLKKLDKQQLSLLEYPHAYHLTDDSSFTEFNEKIRINEWKMAENEDFKPIIQLLSEFFYGRIEEIKQLKDFVFSAQKGYGFVYGHPGIGKSALMAKLLNEIRFEEQQKDKREIVLIEYFIRRNTIFADPSYFFDTMLEKLNLAFPFVQVVPTGSLAEKKKLLHKIFQQISSNLKKQKLVIVIDGLDEGRETGLLDHLMSHVYEQVLIIYTGRPDQDVQQKDKALDCKQLSIVLDKLSTNEIRALLYSVTDKYEIIQMDEYIENLILKKSDGNPLYVRLLCESFSKTEITLETIEQIPEKLEGFYTEMMQRFAKLQEVDEVFHLLALIVAAKDFVDVSMVTTLFNISPLKAQRLIQQVEEVLMEDPEVKGRYQIFHESFRGFFYDRYPREMERITNQLVELYDKWESLEDGVLRYVLEQTAYHLFERGQKETLQSLVKNSLFIKKQIVHTGRFDASIQLCQLAQDLAQKTDDANLSVDAFLAYRLVQMEMLKEKFISSKTFKESDLMVWLDRIKHFTDFEKSYTYLFLIDHYCQKKNAKAIREVFNHLENTNPKLVLNEHIPTMIILQIGFRLNKFKEDITAQFKYCKWNSFNEQMIETYDFSFEVELVIAKLYNEFGYSYSNVISVFKRLIDLGLNDRAKTFINQLKGNPNFIPCYMEIGEYEKSRLLVEQAKGTPSYLYTKLLYLVNMKKIDPEIVDTQVKKLNKEKIVSTIQRNLTEARKLIRFIFELDNHLYEEIKPLIQNSFLEKEIAMIGVEKGNIEPVLKRVMSQSEKVDNRVENLSLIYGMAKEEKLKNQIRHAAMQLFKGMKVIFLKDSEIAQISKVAIHQGDEELIRLILSKDIEYFALTTICISLAEGYTETGNTSALLQLVEKYEDQIPMYDSIVPYLIETGQVELAFEVSSNRTSVRIRDVIYEKIALKAINIGNDVIYERAFKEIESNDYKKELILQKYSHKAGKNEFVMEMMIEELSAIESPFTSLEEEEILLAIKDVSFYKGEIEFDFNWIREIDFDLQGNAFRQIVMRLLEKQEFEMALKLISTINEREFLPYSNRYFEDLMLITVKAIAQSGVPDGEQLIKKYFLSLDVQFRLDELVDYTLTCTSFFRENQLLQQEKILLVAIEKKITEKQSQELYLEVALYYHKIGNEKDAKRLYRKSLQAFSDWQNPRLIYGTIWLQMEALLKKRWKDTDCSMSIQEICTRLPNNKKELFLRKAAEHFEKEQMTGAIEELIPYLTHYITPIHNLVEKYYIQGNIEKVRTLLQQSHGVSLQESMLPIFIKQASTKEHWEMISLIDSDIINNGRIWSKQLTLLSPSYYETALEALPSMPSYMQEVVVEALMFHLFKTPHLLERFLVYVPIDTVRTLQFLRIYEELGYLSESNKSELNLTPLYDALAKLSKGEWSLEKYKQFVYHFEA